jgi:hypothetical protein
MIKPSRVARSVVLPALMILAASPVLAEGKHDRAKEAMAAAQAKIDTANKIGAAANTPRLAAEAEAMLRTAHEDLSRGKKDQAIQDANRAAQLADVAIGEAQHHRDEMAQHQQADAAAVAAAAQNQAADANARADAAQQAAQQAAAAAEAARNAPPVVVAAAPPPVSTTTTTTVERDRTIAHAAPTTKRVVRHTPAKRTGTVARERTTTTVTTTPSQ